MNSFKKQRFVETTNRTEFNKLRKLSLEETAKLKCSHCKYHKGDNRSTDWFGCFDSIDGMKYPNWKLVSKNKKQWMKKPIKIKETTSTRHKIFEIIF